MASRANLGLLLRTGASELSTALPIAPITPIAPEVASRLSASKKPAEKPPASHRNQHYGFLAEGMDDPRPEFMRRLKSALPDTGSIVAYNAPFELGRLAECSELLPEFKSWFKNVERRTVDLLLPFRGFRYHHPDQNGSNSMKAVLPALTGRGYDGLEIQEGGTASMEFLRVTYGKTPEAERRRVRAALEKYCALDTEGMVWIVDALLKLAV